MTTLIPTVILLCSLTGADQNPLFETGALQWRAEIPSTGELDAAHIDSLLRQLASRSEDPWERALRGVFVVPGPDLSGEGLGRISEDMAVMCRILDKATSPVVAGANTRYAYRSGAYGYRSVSRDEQRSVQGLYLDGYGALFFVDVDFPLVPSAQKQTPSEPEASADSMWSATLDELRGVPQEPSQSRGPQYDAQKVDSVKAILTKALRHASNLRVSRPSDVISVVVTGRTGQDHGQASDSYGSDLWHYREGVGRTTGSTSALAALLILRTTKSDVDAFAQGELTEEQFTAKVHVLTSWTSTAREAVGAGPASPPPTPPSRNVRQ